MKKLLGWLGVIFLITLITILFFQNKEPSGKKVKKIKKSVAEKVLITEEYIVRDKGNYKVKSFVVLKNQFMKYPVSTNGLNKIFYIITKPANNTLLWVKMATAKEGLVNTVPKEMTVNQFNFMRDDLPYRYFNFRLPPNSPVNKIHLNFYIKDRT